MYQHLLLEQSVMFSPTVERLDSSDLAWADVNGSYLGTNLEGNVSMGAHDGIQLWDVPILGKYLIEVAGAGNTKGFGRWCLHISGTFDFNGSETEAEDFSWTDGNRLGWVRGKFCMFG